jgi:hypothetical protein
MRVQLTEDNLRADLYYCECCGEFYDRQTHVTVNVPLSEIPADFALEVMAARQKSYKGRKETYVTPKTRGFGK